MNAQMAGFVRIVVTAACCLISISASAQLMNRAEPLAGITTAGQPTAEDLQDVAEEGIVAVIDLRTGSEDRGFDERGEVERLGMRYISLPVEGAAGVDYDTASALDALLAEIDGPVLVHCASSNRVGAVLSLRERLNGSTAEDSLELGLDSGMSSPVLRERVQLLLEAPPR